MARLLRSATAVAAAFLSGVQSADAHGLQIVGRKDVPVPDWLFAWGGAMVLVFSFAVLTLSWREPILNRAPWWPFPTRLSRTLRGRVVSAICGLLGVLLFLLVLWSGFDGTELASENFASTFVFVTFWLGFVPLSLVFGDVFRAFNPWYAIGRAFERLFASLAREERPPLLAYPEWLGRWPAALGLLGFVWFELVFGFAREGVTPSQLAVAACGYTALTFAGMVVFGTKTWLDRGEAFSVFFGMIARLSPVAVRGSSIGLQPPVVGARDWPAMTGSVALICVSIGGTVYDGALESVLSGPMRWLSDRGLDLGISLTMSLRIGGTLLLVGCVLAVALVYWIGVAGMARVNGAPSRRKLALAFAHAMIPIAVAYFVAHYFSLFVFAEQAQFTFLASDPLGRGWDLFGTADAEINYSAIGATFTWYVQVGALVLGHVLGLVLAHERALVIYPNAKAAARSQYWMLAVMVALTTFGLFLLSESNQ